MIYKTFVALSLAGSVSSSHHHRSSNSLADGHSVLEKSSISRTDASQLPKDRQILKKSHIWNKDNQPSFSTERKPLDEKVKQMFETYGKHHNTQKIVLDKFAASKKVHHTTEVQELANEPLQESSAHMRGARQLKKMRDNFFLVQIYSDPNCQDFMHGFGDAVNLCHNEPYGGSVAYKVNRKSNLATQLQYDGPNCMGVPQGLYSFSSDVLPFEEFGKCVKEHYGDMGISWSVHYTSEYPHIAMPGPVYKVSTLPELCDFSAYHYFESYAPNKCVKMIEDDKRSIYVDTTDCSGTMKEIHYKSYRNGDCSGTPHEEGSLDDHKCWIENSEGDDVESPECSTCDAMISTDSSICFQGYGTPPPLDRKLADITRELSHTSGTNIGKCASCGYYENPADAKEAYDCVSCEEGYEIDVVFDDCTGFCVPKGEANRPISKDTCNYPCAHCGLPHHDQAETLDSTSRCSECTANAHKDSCFPGDAMSGKCESCGYGPAPMKGASDCITCEDGYEIDVVYDDCTGYCVPKGKAKKSLIDSKCQMPCASCGADYDGWAGAPPSSRLTSRGGFSGNYVMCPAPLP